MTTQRNEHVKIYRLPIWVRALLLVAESALALLFIFIAEEGIRTEFESLTTLQNALLLLGGLALVAIAGISLWWVGHMVFRDRLIVRDDGLEFYASGVEGFTTWDNLSEFAFVAIERNRENVIRYADRVTVTAHPFMKITGFSAVMENWLPLQYWALIPRKSSVKLEMDVEKFKKTPLGKDLLHYAPHLFEEEKTA
jgi:hypothetical protein